MLTIQPSFFTRPEERDIIQEALHDYENATGSRINTYKSRDIALGSWDESKSIMDVKYYDEMKLQ